MKKKLIIIGAILLAILLIIITVRLITLSGKNSEIENTANKVGASFGVTDFTSDSGSFSGWDWGNVYRIELYSKAFETLSNENKLSLMQEICENLDGGLLDFDYDRAGKPLEIEWLHIHTGANLYHANTDSDNESIVELWRSDDTDLLYENSEVLYETRGRFTNKYGTANTICAHLGCSEYIAYSGDTNCCIWHSNRCGNCRCYIDEDAVFCMGCLGDALE